MRHNKEEQRVKFHFSTFPFTCDSPIMLWREYTNIERSDKSPFFSLLRTTYEHGIQFSISPMFFDSITTCNKIRALAESAKDPLIGEGLYSVNFQMACHKKIQGNWILTNSSFKIVRTKPSCQRKYLKTKYTNITKCFSNIFDITQSIYYLRYRFPAPSRHSRDCSIR